MWLLYYLIQFCLKLPSVENPFLFKFKASSSLNVI